MAALTAGADVFQQQFPLHTLTVGEKQVISPVWACISFTTLRARRGAKANWSLARRHQGRVTLVHRDVQAHAISVPQPCTGYVVRVKGLSDADNRAAAGHVVDRAKRLHLLDHFRNNNVVWQDATASGWLTWNDDEWQNLVNGVQPVRPLDPIPTDATDDAGVDRNVEPGDDPAVDDDDDDDSAETGRGLEVPRVVESANTVGDVSQTAQVRRSVRFHPDVCVCVCVCIRFRLLPHTRTWPMGRACR